MQLTRAHPPNPPHPLHTKSSTPRRAAPTPRAPPSPPTSPAPRPILALTPPPPRPTRPLAAAVVAPWPRIVTPLSQQLPLPLPPHAPAPRPPRRLYLRTRSSRATTRLRAAPRTRADCLHAARPCPWVSCRYHLLAGPGVLVHRQDGWHLPPISASATDAELLDVLFRLPATCTLDVAALGGIPDVATISLLGLVSDDPERHTRPAINAFRTKLRTAAIPANALASSLADGTLTFARPEPSTAPGLATRLTAHHAARALARPPGQPRTLRPYLRAKAKAIHTP